MQSRTADKNSSMSEIWSGMPKAAQRREKQQWAVEKPKLDNAGKLRCIYVTDLDDMKFKDTTKNARKKLESPVESATPLQSLKTLGTGKLVAKPQESARKRIGRTRQKDHEDRISGKGFNSLSQKNLVHVHSNAAN